MDPSLSLKMTAPDLRYEVARHYTMWTRLKRRFRRKMLCGQQ